MLNPEFTPEEIVDAVLGEKSRAKTAELKLTFFDELTEAAPKPWLIKNVIARGEASSWIATARQRQVRAVN